MLGSSSTTAFGHRVVAKLSYGFMHSGRAGPISEPPILGARLYIWFGSICGNFVFNIFRVCELLNSGSTFASAWHEPYKMPDSTKLR